MRPNKLFDVEVLLIRQWLVVLYTVSDNEHLTHLLGCHSHAMDWAHLTNVGHFEHLLAIEGLLGLYNTGQVDKLRVVSVVADVKLGAPGVCVPVSMNTRAMVYTHL